MDKEKTLIRIFVVDKDTGKVGVNCDIDSDEEIRLVVTGIVSLLDNIPEILDDLVAIYTRKLLSKQISLITNSKIKS